MNQAQLETLISAHVVDEVIAHGRKPGEWECWAQGKGIPEDLGNRIRHSSRGREVRVWASLDTLRKWIRGRGWEGRIIIEG